MSAFDWTKLEEFFPGCTHAAIDPVGMLVVMKVEAGVPFFHPANRWIPGDKGVRKDYGLLGVGGNPDFNAQSTLEANPGRLSEIAEARSRGTGAASAPRTTQHANVAASPMHAPTLHELANRPDLQTNNINNQPARVDGMPPERVEQPQQAPAPGPDAQKSVLNELGLDPENAGIAVGPTLGYDPAKPGAGITCHAVAAPSGEALAFGDEAKALAMELAITAQAAAFKTGDQALYDKCKAKVDRLKELFA